jgi:hypothetical protein
VPGHGALVSVVMDAMHFVLREYACYGAVLAQLPDRFLFRDHVGKALLRQAYGRNARHLLLGSCTREWTNDELADLPQDGDVRSRLKDLKAATPDRVERILPLAQAYEPRWTFPERGTLARSVAIWHQEARRTPALEVAADLATVRARLRGVLRPGGPFVLCGGAVLRAICGQLVTRQEHDVPVAASGDLDLFLTGEPDRERAVATILEAVETLVGAAAGAEAEAEADAEAGPEALLLVTRNALTVVLGDEFVGGVLVQFVLRAYGRAPPPADAIGAAEHVLCNFDLPCCQFAFDGETITCTEAAALALRHGINVADILQQSRAGRAVKYHNHGIAYLVPCPDRAALRIASDRLIGALEDGNPAAQAWMRDAVRGAGLRQVLAWTVPRSLWPEPEGAAVQILEKESALYNVLRDPFKLFNQIHRDAVCAEYPDIFAEVVPRGQPLGAAVADRLASLVREHLLVVDPTLRCFDGLFYETGPMPW